MRLLFSIGLALCSVWALAQAPSSTYKFANLNGKDVAGKLPSRLPDARFAYGASGPQQFADLWLPSGPAPEGGYPVMIFVHGGAWRAQWSKDHSEPFVEALSEQGFAVWDMEFRRLGHRGGGFPGTFEDLADGADHLRAAATRHNLNLEKVVAVGHSSGGHLALWLGGRKNLPQSSPLHREQPLKLKGVVSLAGVNDLEASLELGGRTDVLTLIGAESLEAGQDRFAQTNPTRLRPFGVPQTMMIGDKDAPWRLKMTSLDAERGKKSGDATKVVVVPGANHFDVVDPRSGFAAGVAQEARLLVDR